MAKNIHITLSDDLDGTESDAVETVSFGYQNRNYEIDLTPENSERLSAALQPFITNARQVSASASRTKRRSPSGSAVAPELVPKIREWCREKGYSVSDRGRIKGEYVQEYLSTH